MSTAVENNLSVPAGVKLPIYMDNHATTPLDPRVLDAMMPYFTGKFGNAASRNHSFGWEAEAAVEEARTQIAKLIGATAKEIIFTSGATESNNLAIKGIGEMYRERGNHIITQVTEHKAVLDTCKRMEKAGFRVTYLPVKADGLIDLEDLKRAIDDKTILVTIMFANNEIGVIQPVAEIGKICREKGVLFHTDAVQAVGKVPVDVNAMNIDVLSLSGHKIYGPKGVGALYVRRRNPRVQISEQINGGGHERGMRSGTLNVPGIVGLGKACEIAQAEMESEAQRLRALRDKLKAKLESKLDYIHVNGSMEHRLPGNLNMSFVYVEGESLLMGINDVAVSSGSACTSATLEPSYVLKALGLGDDVAHSSIRFGLGRFNTEAEVDYVADKVIDVVQKLRELSPLYEMVKEGIDLTKIEWQAH
ncbi:IscS subfamily cysteine desulfurase [Pseudacidobacterium ailaaui]|jgi:cysteine desulfurase|uniref:IscS subfamily cysteine desulfurase n=1 Tax=Pseudacidobacterium ailaaui TaxID=1382359 RepID=UPI00047E1FE5|nr:IscS subfamily cysteine desulfurase [Pseudacidobacterium ailaaui]MBX6359405.1 IscS subfamily cysteine desulfurase [Pseudacidobacterium ailaaui]MCL6463311.1 IscS subfamily cysteine desulfurase [Pseudacidobacterium ailaaui]MDI3253593.1 IscS subfamily cysteine desulfurase [Bacillota bacterium]